MNRTDRFDEIVTDWLHVDAEHRVPEHLDVVLRRTRTERQRPAWSSLERWLPVQTTLRFAPAPRTAWLLVVVGLIFALATAILVVGSRRQPAPPIGVARNGPIAFTKGGDILRFDPSTGKTVALVSGPEQDGAPYYSLDGQHLVFLRHQGEGHDVATLADADGGNVRMLTGTLKDQTGGIGPATAPSSPSSPRSTAGVPSP